MGYNLQSKKMENIFRRYLSIILKDKVLGKVLPPVPKFVYRKNPNLRNKFAPGVLNPLVRENKGVILLLTRLYSCGKCLACRSKQGLM